MAISNYYVPSSMSQSYVANKRNEDYSPTYLSAKQNVDIEKQGALQNLEKSYASTIENAYASYLANQRNINISAMGEGYKNLYREMQDKQLQENIATTNIDLAKTRAELETQATTAKAGIQEAENLEISNLNRVQSTMQQYLNYVKSLAGTEGAGPLTEEQQNMYIDDLYETLYNLPVKGYTDEKGNPALSYTEWIKSNLTGSEADTAWGDWLFAGGLTDFMTAVVKTRAKEPEKDELKDYSSGINKQESDKKPDKGPTKGTLSWWEQQLQQGPSLKDPFLN